MSITFVTPLLDNRNKICWNSCVPQVPISTPADPFTKFVDHRISDERQTILFYSLLFSLCCRLSVNQCPPSRVNNNFSTLPCPSLSPTPSNSLTHSSAIALIPLACTRSISISCRIVSTIESTCWSSCFKRRDSVDDLEDRNSPSLRSAR